MVTDLSLKNVINRVYFNYMTVLKKGLAHFLVKKLIANKLNLQCVININLIKV